ncbi:TRAP transporter small permease [Pelagibius litoralis]|uniref:TRAP transporter small permease protein n=1 Tax=Pelagibius litoralis TaxID=374515 RepID=A0A967EXS9_9PROT|nr:TRAP transporter small permease [Pelagibius litoralis]NIA69386.1 TRAP transporter small permease [Pelagibius litoralis]
MLLLARIWHFKLFLKRLTLVITCTLFSVVVIVQIVVRYFLVIPMHGLEEIAVYSAVWTYFIGGAYGAYERSHISASLMEMVIAGQVARNWIKVLANAITVVVAVWATVWTFQYFQWSLRLQPRSLELQAPLYWAHASMFVGLGLMAFYFAIEFVDNLLRVLGIRTASAG